MITTLAGIVAGIIVIGIVLVLAKANQNNDLVDFILDIGRFLTRPFRDLFPQDNPRQNVLVNWGIAAIAYLIVGGILARLARR